MFFSSPLPQASAPTLFSIARLLTVAAILTSASLSLGQVPASGDPAPAPVVPSLENAKPDLFYLRDARGNLVYVPDISLEEYNKLRAQQSMAMGALPPYALTNVVLLGRVAEGRADVELRLEISVERESEGPMRIPLGLYPGILREMRYEGVGEAAIGFDRASRDYVCWLRAEPGTRHVLTLNLLVPIRRVADLSRLELRVPDALTHVELVLPVGRPEVEVEGEQFLLQPIQPLTAEAAKIQLDGYGGNLQLRWNTASSGAVSDRPTLSVNGSVVLTIEDPTYLRAEIELNVRAEQGRLEAFHVRFPPGMVLVARETKGFSAQIVEPGTTGLGPLIRIDPEATDDKQATIKLFGEISRTVSGALPIETAGFEVREAFYQRTELLLAVYGEWSVRTLQMQNVRRLSNLSEADRQRGGIAKYVFYSNRIQPASLRVAVQPQESLVTIEPRYLLRFYEQRVRLDAILRFHVRGAATKGFELWVGDWKVREIQPADYLDLTAVPPRSDPKLMSITLAADRLPRTGDFEIRVSAERPIAPGMEPITLELLRPQASSRFQEQSITLVPASLAATAADNIDFAPALTSMPDLTPIATDPTGWLPEELRAELTGQRLLQFQAASGGDPLTFVAVLRRRPQAISALSLITARFEGNLFDVQQTLRLDIRHQPLSVLTLEAPASLVAAGPVSAVLGEDPLNMTVTPVPAAAGRVRLSASLPIPLMGPGTLRLSYRVATPAPAADRRLAFDLPVATLVSETPLFDALTEVTTDMDPGLWRATVSESGWETETTESGQSVFRTDTLASSIPLEIVSAASEGPTVVERAWYQSIVTGDRRVDRAVFRIQSRRSRVEIQLPAGASTDASDITVAVNGRDPTQVQIAPDGSVSATLDRELGNTSYVVEIWYAYMPSESRGFPTEFRFARIPSATALFPTYWQLVVPKYMHLLSGDRALTPELSWQWRGWFFGRVCHLTQRELEDWVGALHGRSLSDQTNQYLFSTYGSVETALVRLASRATLTLWGSGAILAFGLLWIYVRAFRHPAMLLLISVGLAAFAVVRPGASLLLTQAAVVGILLVLASRLAERLMGREFSEGDVPVARLSTALAGDSARSDSIPSVPTIGTTATTPIQYEVSSGEAR